MTRKFYIKCLTCGRSVVPLRWFFEERALGTALAAARMHSMLKHRVDVRLISDDEIVAVFVDGEEQEIVAADLGGTDADQGGTDAG